MFAGVYTRACARVSQDSKKPIGRFHGLPMGFLSFGLFFNFFFYCVHDVAI